MHLVGAIIGYGVPPFGFQDQMSSIRFDERVNVFVGPNASGKSTLMQMLVVSLIENAENSKRPIGKAGPFLGFNLINDDGDKFDELLKDAKEGEAYGFPLCDGKYETYEEYYAAINALFTSSDWLDSGNSPTVPVVHIGAIREGLPGIQDQKSPDAYGATAAEALSGPFSGTRTMCAAQLFAKELSQPDLPWQTYQSDYGFSFRGPAPDPALGVVRAITLADACAKQICDEIVADSEPHSYVAGDLGPPSLANPGYTIPVLLQMGINMHERVYSECLPAEEAARRSEYLPTTLPYDPTEEEKAAFLRSHSLSVTPNFPLYLGHASSGTEGTFLWIRWLALQMAHHYRLEEGWERRPALLLIDEIENHLHPTWQRRVIPALLEHFPGLQIIATTHSPFVVAGLKAGQVHRFQRVPDNGNQGSTVAVISTSERDVIGWTADEILRTLMGVDEPTDQLTVDRANRVRELREKETLTPEEESELQEKRRQVNRDLLAKSGPLEAQRERYADLMRNFLLSRQSDLAQDGG